MKKIITTAFLITTLCINAQLKVVSSITPTTNISCTYYVDFINNKFYFQGSDPSAFGEGVELFSSNGSEAGTTLVKDINTVSYGSSSPGKFTQLNSSTILFVATDNVVGRELWKTDGSSAGTSLVKDIYTGSGSGPFEHFMKMGSNVFFMADDGSNGRELWKSDGTTAGTQLVKNINPSGNGMQYPVLMYSPYTAVLGANLFFVASNGTTGFELYKTDGTTAGTSIVKDIEAGSGSSDPSNFIVVNGVLYFTCSTASDGNELWKTDGTTTGTVLVKDFNTLLGASSNPNYLVSLNNKLYFAALIANKATLCETDGTAIGTNTVFASSAVNTEFCRLTKVDSTIYFFEQSNGSSLYSLYKFYLPSYNAALVKSGLYDGTMAAANQPTKEKAVALNGMLYFTFDNYTNGDELWQSDGTNSGTKMITDIAVGSTTSWIDNLIPINNGANSKLYFRSNAKVGLLYIMADAVTMNVGYIEKQYLNFSLFPNPTNSILNIALQNNNYPTTLEITNTLGQVVLSKNITENNTLLNVSEFTKGIYVMSLKSDNKTTTQKLIVN